jgi:hypothetical protein
MTAVDFVPVVVAALVIFGLVVPLAVLVWVLVVQTIRGKI